MKTSKFTEVLPVQIYDLLDYSSHSLDWNCMPRIMCASPKIWCRPTKRFGMSMGCSYPLERTITPFPRFTSYFVVQVQMFIFLVCLPSFVSLKSPYSYSVSKFRSNVGGRFQRCPCAAQGRSAEQGELQESGHRWPQGLASSVVGGFGKSWALRLIFSRNRTAGLAATCRQHVG